MQCRMNKDQNVLLVRMDTRQNQAMSLESTSSQSECHSVSGQVLVQLKAPNHKATRQ